MKTQPRKLEIEICVGSIESALSAQEGHADRIELCDNLFEGGTTPSPGTIIVSRARLSIKIMVIIRPRGGDFLYSDAEFATMKEDILFCKQHGIDGVVIGLLLEDGHIDVARTKELVELATPMEVTFHRAFDVCKDPIQGLEDIIETGVCRLLTSGCANKAEDGIDVLRQLVEQANGRIQIMAGSGVGISNAASILEKTGVGALHFSGKRVFPSKMSHQPSSVSMSGSPDIPSYDYLFTDSKLILDMRKQLKLEA